MFAVGQISPQVQLLIDVPHESCTFQSIWSVYLWNILFDNDKDNFFDEFYREFSGCAFDSECENVWYLQGTDAFFAVQGNRLVLQDWAGQIYFSLPLSVSLDSVENGGVMLVSGMPKPVSAEILQAAFGSTKGDDKALSQALSDFEAQNGWNEYDCQALCICLFNEEGLERMKRDYEL